MTDRDKVAVLLRRFGLGAGKLELEEWAALGYAKARDRLLNDEQIDEGFGVSHWEFATQADGKIDANAYIVGQWWALRFLMTKRPLQEKLTLFWHDHFALDAEKINEAPMMLGYLDVLRTKGRGKFKDLLHATVKQGAVLTFLDNHASNRIKPNENFARELFELFTLGPGHYTEKDIREASRAFTGWSIHYAGTGTDIPFERLRDQMSRAKLAINNFCVVPALHDDGAKSILGKTGAFDGDDVLDLAAEHPATAPFICAKLWEFFATPNPSKQTIERLVAAWKKSDGEIRAVLRAITDAPEFWAESNVRSKPKSPLDWSVGLFRCLQVGDFLRLAHGKPTSEFTSLKKELRDAAGGIYYLMSQQGLSLLFPPDVGGWTWNEGWVNTESLVKRTNFGNVIFWGGGEDRPFAVAMVLRLGTMEKTKTSEDLVDGLAEVLDVPISADQRKILVERCTQLGGPGALKDKNSAANLFANLGKAMFAIPEMQLI